MVKMAQSLPPQENSKSHFLDVARLCSKQILSQYSSTDEISVMDLNPEQLKFNQYMCMIRISGDELRMAFRTHFLVKEARGMTSSRFSRGPNSLTSDQVVDAMKEYCNETAGRLKFVLETSKIPVGHSLPFALRGFNEMLFKEHLQVTDQDYWRLSGPGGFIDCSMYLYTTQESFLLRLNQIKPEVLEEVDDNSVELF